MLRVVVDLKPMRSYNYYNNEEDIQCSGLDLSDDPRTAAKDNSIILLSNAILLRGSGCLVYHRHLVLSHRPLPRLQDGHI